MQVISIKYPLEQLEMPAQVMAIGDFDGVHLGHRKVIGQAVAQAKQMGVKSAIMTFHPHPREVLGLQKYESLLTPFAHKMELLRQLDVDTIYICAFDQSFSQLSAEQFIENVLQKMNVRTVVIGFDFTFGHRGAGNPEYLKQFAATNSLFSVHIIEPFLHEDEKVSSTRIRNHLSEGTVDFIPDLLGRHYDMSGVVRAGDGRGRKIGFPTANLELDGSYIFPRLGVYAVHASVADQVYRAVVNIGVRPTFLQNPEHANVEVHVLDFDGNLYGKAMRIELLKFLRAEQKFAGVDELVAQIHQDIARTRELFE